MIHGLAGAAWTCSEDQEGGQELHDSEKIETSRCESSSSPASGVSDSDYQIDLSPKKIEPRMKAFTHGQFVHWPSDIGIKQPGAIS